MSVPRVLRRPRVKADLAGHYAFIARDKIQPAERFLSVAAEAFDFLARMPGVGRPWESSDPRLADVRVYPLPRGFRNYIVFYRPVGDGIEILRVLHGARDLNVATLQLGEEDE